MSNYKYGRSCLPCTALPYSRTAAYPRGVRHSMFALSPQCGDTSGASLGVRSVALLHVVNAMAKTTKEDHSMVPERRISIIAIKANGRKVRRKIEPYFKRCNCLPNKNLKTRSVSPTGSHCLRSNSSAPKKEKNITPRCADS